MTYTAGFATIPADIKAAAARLVVDLYSANGRDPNVKRETVEGIGETEYWVGTKDDPALPMDVRELLAPYSNQVFA